MKIEMKKRIEQELQNTVPQKVSDQFRKQTNYRLFLTNVSLHFYDVCVYR